MKSTALITLSKNSRSPLRISNGAISELRKCDYFSLHTEAVIYCHRNGSSGMLRAIEVAWWWALIFTRRSELWRWSRKDITAPGTSQQVLSYFGSTSKCVEADCIYCIFIGYTSGPSWLTISASWSIVNLQLQKECSDERKHKTIQIWLFICIVTWDRNPLLPDYTSISLEKHG